MSSNSTVIPYLPPSDSIFDDVIRGFGLQVFACTFYCTFFYGGLYFIASLIASFNVAHTIPSKVAVVMFSTFWGLFVGFLAGFAVFALIGGIYSSFPLDMAQVIGKYRKKSNQTSHVSL